MLILDDTQTLLKASAADFLAARSPVKALRALRDAGAPEALDHALWEEIANLGWPGALIPESFGGSAIGYKGMGQILEESGRVLLASPLLASSVVATGLLLRAGSPTQQETWLPRLASGEVRAALALDETPRHAPDTCRTLASAGTDGYLLSGAKCFVPEGVGADLLLVVAALGPVAGLADPVPETGVFLVPAGTPGMDCRALRMVDSRNAATVQLNEVRLPATARLGEGKPVQEALSFALDAGRIGLAAEMLGSAEEAFQRTLRYLKLREQFGVPIGSFQALKHRAALLYCELELTRSAVLAALGALDSLPVEVPALASLAKAKACDLIGQVSSEAIQMHGGIGMTDAEEIGFFLKRARVAQQIYGDAGFHRARYAALMGY
ncbi:MAG: acyl-CoA dehydrogenase family protein [Gammaproteobacteria bacterium]|nr:acyl-CoA dehydrogenase family protein [Gammaproteobacteria bacterium]